MSGTTLLSVGVNDRLEGYSGANGYHRQPDGTISLVEDLAFSVGTPVVYAGPPRNGFIYLFTGNLLPLPSRTNFDLIQDTRSSDPAYTYYDAISNGITYRLAQLRIGGGNPQLPLYYSSLALLKGRFDDASAGVTKTAVNPIAFGLSFPWPKTTLTGTAQYRGLVLGSGRGQGGSRVYDVGGTLDLSVDYTTGAFNGQLHLTGRDDRTGQTVDLGTVEIAPAPNEWRRSLDFLITQSLGGRFRFQGNFAGPRAEEFLAGFDLKIADPLQPGVMLAISGVTAGKK